MVAFFSDININRTYGRTKWWKGKPINEKPKMARDVKIRQF